MTNNLTLNRSNATEIVFIDPKEKRQCRTPTTLPGNIRETSVKILGVNISNGLSASEHVRGVVSNSAQTLYALKVLRARRCKPFFGQSLPPSYYMHLVP
jgi:hypothetical protein